MSVCSMLFNALGVSTFVVEELVNVAFFCSNTMYFAILSIGNMLETTKIH